jgi:hypothetical protein
MPLCFGSREWQWHNETFQEKDSKVILFSCSEHDEIEAAQEIQASTPGQTKVPFSITGRFDKPSRGSDRHANEDHSFLSSKIRVSAKVPISHSDFCDPFGSFGLGTNNNCASKLV